MSLGPYASFILISYLAAAGVVLALISWIIIDHRNLTRRLREMEQSGVLRRRAGGAVLAAARRRRSIAHSVGPDRTSGAAACIARARRPQ
jgi:heme exporter protein D